MLYKICHWIFHRYFFTNCVNSLGISLLRYRQTGSQADFIVAIWDNSEGIWCWCREKIMRRQIHLPLKHEESGENVEMTTTPSGQSTDPVKKAAPSARWLTQPLLHHWSIQVAMIIQECAVRYWRHCKIWCTRKCACSTRWELPRNRGQGFTMSHTHVPVMNWRSRRYHKSTEPTPPPNPSMEKIQIV